MGFWWRVFGGNGAEPDTAQLVKLLLDRAGPAATVRFRRDEAGWFAADVLVSGAEEHWTLNRYLTTEEGIRQELNGWAAWLEAAEGNPLRDRLMLHVIQSRQVFTFEMEIDLDPGARVDTWCHQLCRFLARETEGIYQADGQGFFAADGTPLVPER
jgi:hypothetical protein